MNYNYFKDVKNYYLVYLSKNILIKFLILKAIYKSLPIKVIKF